MPPEADFYTGITASIWDMIITFNPTFAAIGSMIYGALILYRLADFFKKVGLGSAGAGWENDLIDLLLLIVIVGIALAFYEVPIPGVGYSVTDLVTGTTTGLARSLDADLTKNMREHWQTIQDSFVEPGLLDFVAGGLYLILTVVILIAKAFTTVASALSLIFSAEAALFGPLFIPWVLLPSARGYFTSWRSAFLQWSFLQVSAYGYLWLFEGYMRRYLTTLPTDIPPERLSTYGMQATVVGIVFILGFLVVGVFNSGLFSGGNSPTIVDHTRLRRHV